MDVKKRVADLLRVAAPDSGASQNEREQAALEVAKLVAKHNLVVGEAPPPPPKHKPISWPSYEELFRRYPPAPPPPPRYAPQDWRNHFTESPCACVVCGRTIPANTECWRNEIHGVRCHSITCDTDPKR